MTVTHGNLLANAFVESDMVETLIGGSLRAVAYGWSSNEC